MSSVPSVRPLLEAAARHLRDARTLLTTSPVQAMHLAGFGPECARKGVPGLDGFGKALGHEVSPNDELRALIAALDSVARRYAWDRLLLDWDATHPELSRWSPEIRYRANDACTAAAAEVVLEQAESVTATLLAALFADGFLPARVLP